VQGLFRASGIVMIYRCHHAEARRGQVRMPGSLLESTGGSVFPSDEAEGQADCGAECRIHRTSQPEESRVKWHLLQILAQSPFSDPHAESPCFLPEGKGMSEIVAERATGGGRGQNLRQLSPWISRRSSLILRIARATQASVDPSATPDLRAGPRKCHFHANEWLRTQAPDDRPDIQLMHFGELPRPELVIRVVPGPVAPCAQGNGGLGSCRWGWSVDSLPGLITRCLGPKGTQPAVSFP